MTEMEKKEAITNFISYLSQIPSQARTDLVGDLCFAFFFSALTKEFEKHTSENEYKISEQGVERVLLALFEEYLRVNQINEDEVVRNEIIETLMKKIRNHTDYEKNDTMKFDLDFVCNIPIYITSVSSDETNERRQKHKAKREDRQTYEELNVSVIDEHGNVTNDTVSEMNPLSNGKAQRSRESITVNTVDTKENTSRSARESQIAIALEPLSVQQQQGLIKEWRDTTDRLKEIIFQLSDFEVLIFHCFL
ncbi:hypothetical protein RFI_00235 [Reticulomyxa filosa]|uniref:Uncharacterized protein n=1 Tax=Reticulomyxa filosa TaxID=46433 RepID=X6PF52_RETFI|nr:hypothetical protein RFI_00235 [Reticulomyxa filosa]|eukprot:ETO36826.1 hypothetical protein RFI_00235 [Reticulomyxa filosa]